MFTMLLTLASCGDTESPVTPPSQNPNDNPADETPGPLIESHTLVIFMQGNNGLADFMDSNLQRIITAYYDMPTELGRIINFYGPSASKAVVVEGDTDKVVFGNLDKVLAEPNVQIRIFGKPEVKGHRRMGVILARGESVEEALAKAEKAYATLEVEALPR